MSRRLTRRRWRERRRGRGAKEEDGARAGKQKRLDRWFRRALRRGAVTQAYARTGPVLRRARKNARTRKRGWRPKPRRSIGSETLSTTAFVVHSLDEMWQLDLSDMQWYNRRTGLRLDLFAIDVFSRYVWTAR